MLIETPSILQQAAKFITTQSTPKPDPQAVVEQLLTCEKAAKKQKENYSFKQFLGTWQLCFITGTKKTRHRAGIMLGAGRYLPQWVKIQLIYSLASKEIEAGENPDVEVGQVQNSVKVGGLKLTLIGPVKFLKPRILAFDFTRIQIQLFGKIIYQGNIRGGNEKEQTFYAKSTQNQAFFAYFLVEDDIIAARGRGGGLALWGKSIQH